MINHERRSFLAILSSAAIAFSISRANAAPETTSVSQDTLLTEIASLSTLEDSDVEKIDSHIDQLNLKYADSLMAQLEAPNTTNEVKIYSIYLLGKLKLVDSAPLLVKNITVMEKRPQFHIWYWGFCPSQGAGALVNIGTKALPAIINGIASTDDKDSQQTLLETVNTIFIYPECAPPYLEKVINAELDPVRKARLQSTIANNKKRH